MREKNHCSACETKLPGWCKVGEWLFDENSNKYFKIEKLDGKDVFCKGFHTNTMEGIRQARVRPWTLKEAIGKVFLSVELNCTATVYEKYFIFETNENHFRYCIHIDNATKAFENILKKYVQPNGMPCGVLEHLNDNGEWVE